MVCLFFTGYVYNRDRLTTITSDGGTNSKQTNKIIYADGEVVGLTDGSNTLNFSYDSKRNIKSVAVGTAELQNHTYTDGGSVKESVATNAKGEVFKIKNDEINGTVTYSYNGFEQFIVNYDKGGNVIKVTDNLSGTEQNYTYDSFETLTSVTLGALKEEYVYNNYGALEMITYSGAVTRTEKYTYEDNSQMRLSKIDYGAFTVEPAYDVQMRVTGLKLKVNSSVVYNFTLQYLQGTNGATTMPSKIIYKDGSYLQYIYDKRENITSINDGKGKYVYYTYDSHGRLIREENTSNGKTYTYLYDSCGNILGKTVSQKIGQNNVILENKVYSYENGRLTNGGRGIINYDEMGRPVRYCGYAMTWTRGKLASYKNSKYDYDCIGRRISKTVSGAVVTYTYDSQGRLIKSSDGMEYYYGGTGVIAFKYNGLLYLYKKDIQGNINAILDSAGNTVVQYEYDTWGNHTVSGSNTALGNLNPFRYRGYFYDTDTGFYYLQTRYYDPEIGRFISPDSVDYANPETVDGLNLYAYCLNNPVNYVDPTGTFAFTTAMIIGAIIGAVIGATVGGVVAYNTAKENGATGGQLFGWTMFGILCGGVIGGAIGAFIGWAAPSVGAFFGTSFKLGSLMLASGKTITISITGGQAVMGLLGVSVWFASDPFVESLKNGMSQHQKQMFKEEIENYKSSEGRGGADNLTKEILREIAKMILEMYR